VLELVGTTTLEDSLQCVNEGGSVCMAGMVGNKWSLDNVSPMGSIPMAVNLTTYAGGPEDFIATPLQDLAEQIQSGKMKVQIGKFSVSTTSLKLIVPWRRTRLVGKLLS
jgi:NADPH:quinone reductase-like Zn-dependent oxidoreductase